MRALPPSIHKKDQNTPVVDRSDINVEAFPSCLFFSPSRDPLWPHNLILYIIYLILLLLLLLLAVAYLQQRRYSKWRQHLLFKAHLNSVLIQTLTRVAKSSLLIHFPTKTEWGPAHAGAMTDCELSRVGSVQTLGERISHVQKHWFNSQQPLEEPMENNWLEWFCWWRTLKCQWIFPN